MRTPARHSESNAPAATSFQMMVMSVLLLLPSLALGQGSWTAATSMPAPRQEPVAGVINGILYVAGGADGFRDSPSLFAYNPATDTWATLASMPHIDGGNDGRYQGAVGVIDGKLYVPGGWRTSPPLPSNSLLIYNPASNTWTTGASMPTLSGCSAAGVIDRKLYVVTACNGYSGIFSFFHVYDPDANTWTRLPDMPTARYVHAAAVLNGKLYVPGGHSGPATGIMEVYDPASNTWSTKAPMPTPRNGATAEVLNGKLYVIGGFNYTSGPVSAVEVYDPTTDAWTSDVPLPAPRAGIVSGVINGKIYVAAGSGPLATLEIFDPQAELTLASTTFFGGGGDQHGTGIAVANGGIFLSGNVQPERQQPSDTAVVLRYSIPPGPAPVWSRTFTGGSVFWDIATTSEGIYGGGWSYSLTSDPVGGKEVKAILTKFNQDGSNGSGPFGSVWVAGSGGTASRASFFSYSGVELFVSVAAAQESGGTVLYVGGNGQPCSYGAYLVAKYDTAGNRLAAATDSSVGIDFGRCFVPSAGGSGDQTKVAVLNGNVYVSGTSGWFSEDSTARPAVWKYSPNLVLQWRKKDTATAGRLRGITIAGNTIYVVGNTESPGVDYLIEKLDESGNILWRKVTGSSGEDILNAAVFVGSRLFAVGYTRSKGAGGADAVVLEINPANGDILREALFGGAQDDLADSAATDGTDLYVVGESRSFANGGNAIGQNDIMLLRYTLGETPTRAAPTFSQPVPQLFPEVPYLTCIIGDFEPSGVHNWKIHLRSTATETVDLLVVATTVNPAEAGAIRAVVTDENGAQSVTVPHPAANGDSVGTLSLRLQGGRIYDLRIERVDPLTGAVAHHYRVGAADRRLELGWADPLQYLEPHDQFWAVNGDSGEDLGIEFFADPPPAGGANQATSVRASLNLPNGTVVVPSTTLSLPGALSVPGFAGGALVVRVEQADGHFRMRKSSGSDRGFYVIPCPPPANRPPEARCRDVTVFTGPNADSCAVPASIDNGSFDPDGDPITITQNPAGPYLAGQSVVTMTVTDDKGASAQCSATVTVIDNTPPTVQCPPGTTASANASCSAVIPNALSGVVAADNCTPSGLLNKVQTPLPGTVVGLGTHPITVTVWDAAGNQSTCSTTFTVVDTTPPQIICPANIVVGNDPGQCSAVVNFQAPAIDNCSTPTVVCNPPSGSAFPKGTTTVTCTATDAAGNTSTCSFTVTVNDTEPPVIAGSGQPGPRTCETPEFLLKWGTFGSGDGQFKVPQGVGVDTAGNVYVPDAGNNRIQKFDASGNFLLKWGSGGSGNGQFNNPLGVAVDASGNIYVSDNQNHRVQKFDAAGNFLIKWGSFGSGNGQFREPIQIAVGPDGNIYVADYRNHRVQVFDAVGNFLTKWGSFGSADGQFDRPTGIALDGIGNVYVADEFNHRIQKFDSAGNFITKWGSNGTGDGQMRNPHQIAAEDSGNVYVTDHLNQRIQKFDSNGTFLTKWGSLGSGDGEFAAPSGVAVDAFGNVYVADTSNHRIQKFGCQQPPTSCLADIVVANAPGQCGAVVNFPLPAATDNCPAVTVSANPPSGSLFPVGTTAVVVTATDAAGNQSTCGFTVTVNDTESPVLTLPANIVANPNPGQCSAVVSFAVSAMDNCPGVTVITDIPSGAAFPNGITTVTGTATDAAGNITTGTFTVTVEDQEAPSIVCPQEFAIQAWVARYNHIGNSADIAGQNNSFAHLAMAVDDDGNVYVTGQSASLVGAGNDFATVKYDKNGNEMWVARYNGPGNGNDHAHALAIDTNGNVYVTGESFGAEGNLDYATVKYDKDGNQLWVARYAGSAGFDGANALTVDQQGNAYVTGRSAGTGSGNDIVTIKYDPQGNQLWLARYNGTGNSHDSGNAIAVDAAGNVYVAGNSTGLGSNQDYITIKYDSTGNELWTARYSGPGNGFDKVWAMTLDRAGNIYITGQSVGPNALVDYATIKYNTNGDELWVARFDEPGNTSRLANIARTIAVDDSQNVYVTGQVSYGGVSSAIDAVTVKYDTNGNQLWSARYDTSQSFDSGEALVVDSNGSVYIAGRTAVPGKGLDYMAVKYDSNGQLLWSSRLSGVSNANDRGYMIALDREGSVHLSGQLWGGESNYDYGTVKYIQNTRIPADENCQAAVPDMRPFVSVADNCTAPNALNFLQVPAPGTLVGIGTHVIQVTAIDATGNAATCTTSITVIDTTPPTLVCPANIVVANDPGQCLAVVSFAPQAADNCGPATVVCNPPGGSSFPKGTTTVTCTATDAAGNTSACSFTVTVNDTEKPVLALPANIVANTDPGQCLAAVSFAVSATDNCPGVTFATDIPSGTAFPKGTTTVTATATDAAGSTVSGSFTVTVEDHELPAITCPANIVVSTDPGQCSAVVNFATQASDNCPGVTVVCNPPSGSSFPKGTTTVTCAATDASGNTSTCSFTVTVNDTESPQVVCPANIVVGNDPGQCSAVVNFSVTATDNCPGVTVTTDIPSGASFPKGTTTVTGTATDASGNVSTCSFTVTVEDREAPVADCTPTTNPSGNNVPKAGNNPKSGQNPDGFYQLSGGDNCDGTNIGLFIKDSASAFVAGPFKAGDKVKITQAPGVTPNQKPMAGDIVAHLQLKGDALVFGVDSAGNASIPHACLVPPPPK